MIRDCNLFQMIERLKYDSKGNIVEHRYFLNVKRAASVTGVDESNIYKNIKHKRKTVGGYVFNCIYFDADVIEKMMNK